MNTASQTVVFLGRDAEFDVDGKAGVQVPVLTITGGPITVTIASDISLIGTADEARILNELVRAVTRMRDRVVDAGYRFNLGVTPAPNGDGS